ncbi:MAG: sulfite exporter TauE/SafE family protein [Sodalinema sp.]|uniref:sulfite exporter TauE/SafE family protein n=1 Tax=Sodalinema sp. TaxID=3080550 RepID=UPI0011F85831|nr:MAG: sulfite exporter TauE/SafE family protein [Phormidium sp. SL48-SHIP]
MEIGQLLLIFLGLITGIASGVLGIGGGILMVPGLLAWGLPIQQASATSLVAVFINALSGTVRNWRAGDSQPRGSLGLAIGGISTAQLGAEVATWVPAWALAFSFAALQLLTIYFMGLRRRLAQNLKGQDLEAQDLEAQDLEAQDHLTSKIDSIPPGRAMAILISIGLLAGFLSGLFGIGGGAVMVPLQMLLVGMAIKPAIRNSLGAIMFIALSGLIRHSAAGNVFWLGGVLLGLGGMIGAQLGSRSLPKLPDSLVNVLFRLLLLAMAGYTVARGIEGLRG